MKVLVPDIGGFKDVSVIEVLVKDGQSIDKETPLITLETEKAAMDVPAPAAGRIAEVKLKQGDKVSEGSLILLLEAGSRRRNRAPPLRLPRHRLPAAAAPRQRRRPPRRRPPRRRRSKRSARLRRSRTPPPRPSRAPRLGRARPLPSRRGGARPRTGHRAHR